MVLAFRRSEFIGPAVIFCLWLPVRYYGFETCLTNRYSNVCRTGGELEIVNVGSFLVSN